MIDFIQILNLNVEVELILNNDLLDFPTKVIEKTGELMINQNKSTTYKGLIFTITPFGTIKIKGSLHKYFNNGEHNYNDFTYSDLINVIIDFCEKFLINPLTTKLNNLEFGVNIRIPYNPNFIIDNLIHYQGIHFNRITRAGQNFAECVLQRYYLKIYNKGLQYNQENYILRIEIKTRKSEHLKQFNVKYLSDVLIYDNLFLMGNCLVNTFNHIVYWNHGINPDIFPEKQRDLLIKGQSIFYWKDLKQNQRSTYYNKLKLFKELVNQHGQHPFYEILDLISEKWKQLLNNYPENLDKLTDFENTLRKQEIAQINISYKLLKRATAKRCIITGLDISMQKEKSKFLSHSGIKNIYKNDYTTFEKLQKRLSSKWINESLEIQIREIAHSIRNESSNLHHAIRRIEREPTLFPTVEFMREEKKKIFN